MESSSAPWYSAAKALGLCIVLAALTSVALVHAQAQQVATNGLATTSARNNSTNLPITFFPPNATSVSIDGVTYEKEQAFGKLPEILATTDAQLKTKWLKAISLFRTDIHSNLVSGLIAQFHAENSDDVRRAILNTIRFSRDARFSDLCISAKSDPDRWVRLLAAASMIERSDTNGVDVITSCLPPANEGEQRAALQLLLRAIDQFGLAFDGSANEAVRQSPSRANWALFVSQWTNWWSVNRSKYVGPR